MTHRFLIFSTLNHLPVSNVFSRFIRGMKITLFLVIYCKETIPVLLWCSVPFNMFRIRSLWKRITKICFPNCTYFIIDKFLWRVFATIKPFDRTIRCLWFSLDVSYLYYDIIMWIFFSMIQWIYIEAQSFIDKQFLVSTRYSNIILIGQVWFIQK